jgi:hypothetical protein
MIFDFTLTRCAHPSEENALFVDIRAGGMIEQWYNAANTKEKDRS